MCEANFRVFRHYEVCYIIIIVDQFYQPRLIDEYTGLAGIRIGRRNRSTRRNLDVVQHRPP
jgi:hypothetical protein